MITEPRNNLWMPVDTIGASGPVNGMHEPDRGGAYVKIVAIYRDGERHVFAISRGAAEVLAAEILGALANG